MHTKRLQIALAQLRHRILNSSSCLTWTDLQICFQCSNQVPTVWINIVGWKRVLLPIAKPSLLCDFVICWWVSHFPIYIDHVIWGRNSQEWTVIHQSVAFFPSKSSDFYRTFCTPVPVIHHTESQSWCLFLSLVHFSRTVAWNNWIICTMQLLEPRTLLCHSSCCSK